MYTAKSSPLLFLTASAKWLELLSRLRNDALSRCERLVIYAHVNYTRDEPLSGSGESFTRWDNVFRRIDAWATLHVYLRCEVICKAFGVLG